MERKVRSCRHLSIGNLPELEKEDDNSHQLHRQSSAPNLFALKDTTPCAPRRRYSLSSDNGSNHDMQSIDTDIDDDPPVTPKAQDRRWSASAASPARTVTSASSSFVTDTSEDVSLTDSEIEKYVMASIPEHIRKKMSNDMWKKLFTVDIGNSSSQGSQATPKSADISDDVSELSATMRSEDEMEIQSIYESPMPSVVQPAAEQQAPQEQAQEPVKEVVRKLGLAVVFSDTLQVRQYERILDVHPSTSSGPSVGIGWNYIEETSEIDWYKPAGCASDMLLSRTTRERMVRLELGYSKRDMANAVRQNLKLKNSRRRTVNNLQEYGSFAPVEKVEYMIERCQRRLGRLKIGRRSSSRT